MSFFFFLGNERMSFPFACSWELGRVQVTGQMKRFVGSAQFVTFIGSLFFLGLIQYKPTGPAQKSLRFFQCWSDAPCQRVVRYMSLMWPKVILFLLQSREDDGTGSPLTLTFWPQHNTNPKASCIVVCSHCNWKLIKCWNGSFLLCYLLWDIHISRKQKAMPAA